MSDKMIIGKNVIDTLVAITEDDHVIGLMYKAWPPPVMTFPYSNAEVRKFWMKNTISPLDIIFCHANRIISIHKGEPLSLRYLGPNEPTDMVIEMPLGMASKLNISIGQDVKLQKSIKTVAAFYSIRFSKISE